MSVYCKIFFDAREWKWVAGSRCCEWARGGGDRGAYSMSCERPFAWAKYRTNGANDLIEIVRSHLK
jgi:hypothetical protein